jgi:hypothetical protein
MNYNTTANSQVLPPGIAAFLPNQYAWIKKNQNRGDWLAVIGRQVNDAVLTNKFVTNFKQGT